MDEVCSEIGQEWRRLCRKMGFSDGECEQFRQDFHVSGTYEITYQVIVPLVDSYQHTSKNILYKYMYDPALIQFTTGGAQWLSGRASDCVARGRGSKPTSTVFCP